MKNIYSTTIIYWRNWRINKNCQNLSSPNEQNIHPFLPILCYFDVLKTAKYNRHQQYTAAIWSILLHYGLYCCIMGYAAALWVILLHYGLCCCIMGYTAALWFILLNYGLYCCIMAYAAALWVILLHYGLYC